MPISKENRLRKFWEKVDKHAPNGCWEWQGWIGAHGYGETLWSNKKALVHRLSWELHSERKIAKGMFVCHRCDNRKCLNPAHLFEGTCLDNNRDMREKGRDSKKGHLTKTRVAGTANTKAKLTEQQVIEIRANYDGKTSYRSIGEQYGVDKETIGRIIRRELWTHI